VTLNNPIHRFVHRIRYGDGGGYDYFEWVNESLDERVRSMMVGLMVNNEITAAEIKKFENDFETQKHELKKMKEKNGRLKLKLCACHIRQKLYLYFVIVLILIVVMYMGHVCEQCSFHRT